MRTRPFTLLTEDEIKRLIYNGKELKVELSEEELKPLTGLDKFISCSFSLDSDFLDDRLPPVIKMTVYLECDIIDNVTFKKEHEVFFDTDDVVITSEDEEEEIERIRQMKEASATSIYEDAKTNLSTKKDENSSINTPTE